MDNKIYISKISKICFFQAILYQVFKNLPRVQYRYDNVQVCNLYSVLKINSVKYFKY